MLGRRLGELTEVLLLEVEGSEAGLLATLAVVQVVVIKAQHGGGVGDERVGVGVAALGGVALPPKREVMRRMKVDLPQPESAARPMRTGPSRSALTVTLRLAARTTDFPETREPWNLRAARGCAHAADMVMEAIFRFCVRGKRTTRRREVTVGAVRNPLSTTIRSLPVRFYPGTQSEVEIKRECQLGRTVDGRDWQASPSANAHRVMNRETTVYFRRSPKSRRDQPSTVDFLCIII